MKLTLLGSLLLAGICTQAQPVMVSDFNPIGNNGSNPCWLTNYNNKLLFFADNGINGNELCAYDDTAITVQADLNPVSAGGPSSNYRQMARINNDIYFPGDDGNTGIELYKWTGSGLPALVAEIRNGALGSAIDEIIVLNNKLYFNANNGTNGNELWTYDPATNSALRLTDLAAGSASSDPHNFIVYKNKLYFTAFGSGMGTELYSYDPATNATSNAADIYAGTGSSDPQALTLINDKMYLTAYTLTYGRELYMFDGKNTVRLTNIDNAANDGATPILPGQNGIISYKNMILFSGNTGFSGSQLFEYNPSNGVSSLVFMMNPIGDSNPANFINYAGKIFFTADDGVNGNELWSYDGIGQPVMVGDIDSGINSSDPMDLTKYRTGLYFSASTISQGRELYMILDSAALTIQNVAFKASVTVYPNPASSAAHLQIDLHNSETLNITVADMTGKMVYTTGNIQYPAGKNHVELPVQNLAPGMYVYKITGNTGKMLASGRIEKQ